MPLTTQSQAPSESSFTSLSAHQESTPSSFFAGPPVLHAKLTGCRILATQDDLRASEELRTWWGAVAKGESEQSSDIGAEEGRLVKQRVDVWVSTQSLTLSTPPPLSPNASDTTLIIPYPAISLHATQRLWHTQPSTYTSEAPTSDTAQQFSAIYLQIDPAHDMRSQSNPNVDDGGDDGDGGASIALLIVPPSGSEVTNGDAESVDGAAKRGGKTPNAAAAETLFEALSVCADLWPDENDDGEGEGGGGMAMLGGGGGGMPGEGGWITAENAHEFEGMFAGIGDEDAANGVVMLGPGAGTRRARDGEAEANADADGDEKAKPGEEEPKWQRTG